VVGAEASGILWRVLRIVERTVLPRTVTLKTVHGRIEVDMGAGSVFMVPWRDGASMVDVQFRHEAARACEFMEAPGVCESLRQGRPSGEEGAGEEVEALVSVRDALLRLWGRALVELCGGASNIEVSVGSAGYDLRPEGSVWRRLGFNAVELLGAVSPYVAPRNDSQVMAFYAAQRRTAPDAWLFHVGGWPAGAPSEVDDLGRIDEMGEAAQTIRMWRDALEGVSGPIMSVLMGPQQEAFRCVAVDKDYVALVTRPSAELGAALAAWRLAQQANADPHSSA
jgi:hypothetical protein